MTNLALAIEAQLDEQERAKQPITPKPETGSQKVCPNCNSNIPNNAKFCPNCGGKQPENVKKVCSKCGNTAPNWARFCGECGTQL